MLGMRQFTSSFTVGKKNRIVSLSELPAKSTLNRYAPFLFQICQSFTFPWIIFNVIQLRAPLVKLALRCATEKKTKKTPRNLHNRN